MPHVHSPESTAVPTENGSGVTLIGSLSAALAGGITGAVADRVVVNAATPHQNTAPTAHHSNQPPQHHTTPGHVSVPAHGSAFENHILPQIEGGAAFVGSAFVVAALLIAVQKRINSRGHGTPPVVEGQH